MGQSSNQTDINIIDDYACALMLHPRYKLNPPANSKFSLFPLRPFLHYITLDNWSCFERVASRNSVRTAIKKIKFHEFRDTYSLFVEADECFTLGCFVTLLYEANENDSFSTKYVGNTLYSSGQFLF